MATALYGEGFREDMARVRALQICACTTVVLRSVVQLPGSCATLLPNYTTLAMRYSRGALWLRFVALCYYCLWLLVRCWAATE
jgi:hypothetical protein